MYRVMLVEKDRLMLEKLSAVIERTPNFSMAVRYQNKQDALGQGRMFDPNLILLDIPEGETGALLRDAIFKAYPTAPGFFTGYASSCTGNAYCNFAPIETKPEKPLHIVHGDIDLGVRGTGFEIMFSGASGNLTSYKCNGVELIEEASSPMPSSAVMKE